MNLSEIQEKIEEEGLRYMSDKSPGWFRQKHRNVFTYYDTKGNKIKDGAKITRIKNLVIPPAWEKVWISPKKNGHIQATGIDEKGRKQYIYHPEWIRIGQENKFSKVIDFGNALPALRRRISYDMKLSGMDKRKILATIVWLLEHTFIRIGNETYSKENNSYGLTTLRNRHVQVKGSDVMFSFKGKSGVSHELEISHPVIAKTIKKCIELPGYELFQYVDENKELHSVDSQDVNDFLREITGDSFTAKDFRTWGGTNIASTELYKTGDYENKTQLKKILSQTYKTVSEHLGNTVSVCRSYYIHPTVVNSYSGNLLVPHFLKHDGKKSEILGLEWDEYALVQLLKSTD